jgi:Leucine-rich repeat (LRR) protein
MSRNKLESLPADLCSSACSPGLAELNISENHLSTLPDEFAKLVELQVLRADHNQLSSLQCLGQLGSLKQVSANHNQLTQLPLPATAPLWSSNLMSFAANHNRIAKVPELLLPLLARKVIFVGGNPLEQNAPSISRREEEFETSQQHQKAAAGDDDETPGVYHTLPSSADYATEDFDEFDFDSSRPESTNFGGSRPDSVNNGDDSEVPEAAALLSPGEAVESQPVPESAGVTVPTETSDDASRPESLVLPEPVIYSSGAKVGAEQVLNVEPPRQQSTTAESAESGQSGGESGGFSESKSGVTASKLAQMREWADTVVMRDLLPSLEHLRKELDATQDLTLGLKSAQVIRSIKRPIDEAREEAFWKDVEAHKKSLPDQPTPPGQAQADSQLDQLKNLGEYVLRDLANALRATTHILNVSDDKFQQVNLGRVISEFNAAMVAHGTVLPRS